MVCAKCINCEKKHKEIKKEKKRKMGKKRQFTRKKRKENKNETKMKQNINKCKEDVIGQLCRKSQKQEKLCANCEGKCYNIYDTFSKYS